MTPISLTDAVARYGPIVDGRWVDEAKHCVLVTVPSDLATTWINSATGKPTTHVYCNKDIAQALVQALCNVRERGLTAQLRTFDGCYEVRDIRGEPGKVSIHSYALGPDVNAATNRLGSAGDITPELVKCFTDEGFIWGGTFKRRDFMHFQLAAW